MRARFRVRVRVIFRVRVRMPGGYVTWGMWPVGNQGPAVVFFWFILYG